MHHHFSSKREFCDEIKMNDMNMCNEIIKYMSAADLYTLFGTIPDKSELLELEKSNLDEFLELLELLIIHDVDLHDYYDIYDIYEYDIHYQLLLRSAKLGYLNILNKFVKNPHDRIFYIAYGGMLDMSELDMSELDMNTVAYGASQGGHMDIVQEMIRRGVQNFNAIMAHASEGGHINIVREMIRRGATDFNRSLYWALENGHIDIVNELYDHFGIVDDDQ
jgi:ankyrin repeat protein